MALRVTFSCVNHEIIRQPDCSTAPVTISLAGQVQHASCGGDGGFSVRIEPNDRPYSISINGIEYEVDGLSPDTLHTFQSLPSGDYLLELTDVRGCTDTLNVRIQALSSKLSVSVLPQPDNLCNGSNGSAMATVSDAAGYFDIYLDDQFLRRDKTAAFEIPGLEAGVYSLEVVDSALCRYRAAVHIPRGPSGVSWTVDIQPIVQTYCAKSGCHVAETGRVDFTSFSNVRLYSSQIKSRVLNRSMPYDGPLPDDYIEMIVCWIDDGALAN